MSSVKLDIGLKKYDIEDMDGNIIGSFSFNPSDTKILDRYEKAIPNMQKIIDKADEYREKDGNPFEKLDADVSKVIDEIFNHNVAENFLNIMGFFSPVGGKFFVEQVFEILGSVIQQEVKSEMKDMDAKIKKHTEKYKKG